MRVTWSKRAAERNEQVYHIIANGSLACNHENYPRWYTGEYESSKHNSRLCTKCMFSSALVKNGIELKGTIND